MTTEEINVESGQDKMLTEVRNALKRGKLEKLQNSRLRILKELCVKDNIVLRGARIIIPDSLKKRTLSLAHKGYPGIVAMKHKLRCKVWWERIDKDAERVVKSCRGYQLVEKLVESSPLKLNLLPEGPWESIAMDLMGPLPTGESILVVTDYYSRFFETVILKNTNYKKTFIRNVCEVRASENNSMR